MLNEFATVKQIQRIPVTFRQVPVNEMINDKNPKKQLKRFPLSASLLLLNAPNISFFPASASVFCSPPSARAAHGPTPPTSPRLRPAVPPVLPLLTSLSSPRRESCSTCQTAPRVVSSHPAINSLFHSQGYDKVIMHGPCAAPAHAWTCARTCTRTRTRSAPVALMEVDITFPLNIPWMSSIRESWQPSAPPPTPQINLSLRF